jgi:hypothetical protein
MHSSQEFQEEQIRKRDSRIKERVSKRVIPKPARESFTAMSASTTKSVAASASPAVRRKVCGV